MEAFSLKVKLWLAAAAAFSVLAFAGSAGSAAAQASTSPYCGGWLGGGKGCNGSARWLYQTYGWGDQAGVCVALGTGYEWACVPRANEGVYSPAWGSNIWVAPLIVNPASINNFVHGVALTH